MRNRRLIISVVFILLSVSLPTFGKILLEGDFEKLESSSVAEFGYQKMEIGGSMKRCIDK